MSEFEAFAVLKTREFTIVNDCFQDKSNEEIGHCGQTLIRKYLFFIILTLALAFSGTRVNAQTHTIYHDIYYETYNQNMWGPNGSPFNLNVHVDLFDFDYDSSISVGWMDTILGIPFGAMFYLDTWFHLGSDFEMYGWTTGWVDVEYPVELELTIPDDYTFNPGEVVTLNSDYTVLPGAELYSHFPQAGVISLDLDFGTDINLGANICLAGCDSLTIMDISVPLDSIPIFYLNGQTGEAIYPCLQNGWPALCTTYVLPITFNNLFGMGISGWITLPYIETTSVLNTADPCHQTLEASGDSTYMYLEIDIVQFLSFVAGLIPPPTGPAIQQFLSMLHGTYDMGGGIYIEYNLFTALFEITSTMQQDLTFNPFIHTILSFPTPVEYSVTDPNNANQLIDQGVSDTVSFLTCYDFNYRYPCYGWPQMEIGYAAHLDNEFTNHVWDSLAFVFSIEALEFTITLPFPFMKSYSMPPLCLEGTDENGDPFTFCLPEITGEEYYPHLVVNDSLVPTDSVSKNGPKPTSWTIGPLIDFDIPLGYIPITWFEETWELADFDVDTVFQPFTMVPNPEFVMNTTFSNNLCASDSIASITVTVEYGTPPYIYSWSNGVIDTSYSTTNTLSGLLSGTYTVTASDINGCTHTESFIIEDINPPIYVNLSATNVLCHGFTTGSINTVVNGGTPGFDFIWSPSGDTVQNPYNLPAGFYTVTVTDNVGCPQVSSIEITEPPTYVEITLDSVEHVHCYGGNNGYIGISVNGGVPGYTYIWSNASQQEDVGNLGAYTYTVIVTDSHGCTLSFTQTINQPPLLTASLLSTDATCYGLNNGTINLSPGGGTPPYTYNWSNGATTQDLNQIPSGAYQVTVSDSYQCIAIASVYIAQPGLPILAALDITHVRCFGDSTGSIDLSTWGGTPPYQYLWNNGQSTPWLMGLFAGNYSVTITDDNGCDTVILAHVNEGSNLQVTINTFAPSCYGYCDGQASAIVTSGFQPYSYQWSNGSTDSYAGGLCMGLHIVTVVDNNQCAKDYFFVVPEPVRIYANFSTPGIACNGLTTDLTVNVTSGNPPYSYLWNTGATTVTITGIQSGIYDVIITDNHNCTDTMTYNLTQPNPIIPGEEITNVRCILLCNGSIELNPHGGTAPYSYLWSTGLGLPERTNLCQGTYPVTVSDAHGCTSVVNAEIQNLNLGPHVTAVADNYTLYYGQSTNLNAQSTSAIYMYQWQPASTLQGSAMQHPVAIPEGTTTYIVTVTDNYGCTSVDSVTINVLDVICNEPYIFVPNAFSPNGDGENDFLYVYAPMAKEIYIAVYTRWGEMVFVSEDITRGWDGTYKGELMSPDVFVFYVKVTCQNDKIFEKSGNITLLR